MTFSSVHTFSARYVLATVVLVVAACTHSEGNPGTGPTAPVMATSSSSASASDSASSPAVVAVVASSSASSSSAAVPSPSPTAAWTDPYVVAHLAKNCMWTPTPASGEVSPLSCALEIEQSCNPDECYGAYEQCIPRCSKACETCESTCGKSCESCKKPCKDDACRQTCATTCGGCRQSCLTDKDHCATAGCGAESAKCDDRLAKAFEASGCESRRDKFSTCVDTCVEKATKVAEKNGGGATIQDGWSCQQTCANTVLGPCKKFFPRFRIY